MKTLWQDLRYAVRMLGKSPGFTAVAVVSLALGIGGVTTIFSVLSPAVLRPLPFEDADRLVVVWETRLQEGSVLETPPQKATYLAWKEHSRLFDGIEPALQYIRIRTLLGDDGPEKARSQLIGPELFELLGIGPILGRTFRPKDFSQGSNSHTVVLSESYWRRRFGGGDVLGKTLHRPGQPGTVVGVVPDSQVFPWADKVDFWRATNISRKPGTGSYRFLARLKPGVSIEQAEAELEAIRRAVEPGDSEFGGASGVRVQPLREYTGGRYAETLYLLLGAVGFVLLIACVNLANLLLGRGAAREKEIATRAALGAGRWRLIRQLLTEGLLLSFVGGVLGVLAAVWGTDLFVALAPDFYPSAEEVGIDGLVLGFALGISLMTGLLFGMLPALRASKVNFQESLNEGTRGATGGTPRRGRRLLVVSEVALALVLLVGAGLITRSFARLLGVGLGFDAENLLTAQIQLEYSTSVAWDETGKKVTSSQVAAFYEQLLNKVENLPGVKSVGMMSSLPPRAPMPVSLEISGRLSASSEANPVADYAEVDEDFFGAMGVPLLKGRLIDQHDRRESEGVAIINETFARRFFPEGDPLGQTLQATFHEDPGDSWRTAADRPRRVIGVVGDIRYRLRSEPAPAVYTPYRQHVLESSNPFVHIRKTLAIRTASDPASLAGAVRGAALELDPGLVVLDVMTMEERISEAVGEERLWMRLLGLFALAAVLMAAIGLFGVVSYSVARRTQEFGLRMALGAQRMNVFKLVGREVLLLSLSGVAIGVVAALGLTPLLSSQLYGVTATDPATFLAVSVLLIGVAMVACYLPARRATKVDPVVALRYE